MKKNEYTKNYDITIVGGGLAGKLMLAALINSGLFDENKLCWINTDNENFKDVRVSFINYKNFIKLKKHIKFNISSKDYSVIDKIELHNTNEKYPLKLNDLNNHGIIIRNDILKKNIKFSEKKLMFTNLKLFPQNLMNLTDI